MKTTPRPSLVIAGLLALLLVSVTPWAVTAQEAADTEPTQVSLVAINDLHGRLLPVEEPSLGGEVGGVAYLATHLQRLRQDHPGLLVVDAGDMTGATIGLSNDFGDEPTVEAMNLLGLDVGAAGNHEFDDGLEPLLRLRDGGCWLGDCGYRGGTHYPGAAFTTLSSNVFHAGTRDNVFPAWAIREVDGVAVGFVGATATGSFTEPAEDAIDHDPWWAHLAASVEEVRERGADVLVLVRHQGTANTSGGVSSCPTNETFRSQLRNLDGLFDVVVDAHTHSAYVCDLPDAPLATQAFRYGTVFTEIHLQVDPATGEVVERDATNRVVTHDVPPDRGMLGLLAQYEEWREDLLGASPLRATRVAGDNRITTAALLARRFDEADTVLLARADHFADALVAGPLAGQEGAPLLLTHRDGLADTAEAELRRLRPSRVVLVGGTSALGPEVAADVRSLPWISSGGVDRIAGADRYETAARVATHIRPDGRREAFLTTGTNYPDALAGAALAAEWGAPMLLTHPTELPAATRAALSRSEVDELVVLGATGAVSSSVADQAASAARAPVRRIAGADRYATAAKIATRFDAFSTAFVATGQDFPDALAGVAAAARVGAPLLLVPPDRLPGPAGDQLGRVDTEVGDDHVVVIGGRRAISDGVMDAITALR